MESEEKGGNMVNDHIIKSVCMATYNGALYIKRQIDSIMSQIDVDTEIVIIDDCSKDNTVKLIKEYNDSRIKVYINESNCGVNKSFEKAIALAKGDYIFCADQDDIWVEGRFEAFCKQLEKYYLVSGNTVAIDGEDKKIDFYLGKLYTKDSGSYKKNIIRIFMGKAYYYGCAMAFRNELRRYILPFPNDVESHDLYIAMAANLLHSNYHMEDIVLQRRIHGNNASVVKRRLFEKINSRKIFINDYRILRERIGHHIEEK